MAKFRRCAQATRRRRHSSAGRRQFTLIEILVTMAIFVVIMFGLFRFMASAQQAWSLTTNSVEVYSNARIAMDLIGRDLQGALARASDWNGQNITFDQATADSLSFVTTGDPANSTANSNIIEVGYRLNGTVLQRQLRDSGHSGWNPYGSRSAVFTDDVGTEWQDVVDGVTGLTFSCAPTSTPSDTTALPEAVQVQLDLVDQKALALLVELNGNAPAQNNIVKQNKRSFMRTFFLGGRL